MYEFMRHGGHVELGDEFNLSVLSVFQEDVFLSLKEFGWS